MNRILSRGRSLRRIAAATAIAVGGALLAVPGAAAAQVDAAADVDCSALGDNPIAAGLEAALEAAVACDVEVRIDGRATPYATLYATPGGQLHHVGTAAPTQENGDRGLADATLTEVDGVLVQANTAWQVRLSHTDIDAPLLQTEVGAFHWLGLKPEPTYSDATAVYDELAPGLDLTAEVGVSSVDLAFTAADEIAWDALATSLSVTSNGSISSAANVIHVWKTYAEQFESATPFIVRDAAGTRFQVTYTRAVNGTITITMPDEAAVAYPVTLETTWAGYNFATTAWGSVASGVPDQAVYRGESGFDQPYFEAAGMGATSVVGSYCDQIADPECAVDAQARSYWGFWLPDGRDLLTGDDSPWLDFALASATFQVDAADGSTCVAPDLTRTGIYVALHNWNRQPNTTTVRSEGTCQSGTAVYDVTSTLTTRFTDYQVFGMLDSAETARFDGGSARFDAYLDIDHYQEPTIPCAASADTPKYTGDDQVTYGGFTALVWRPDLFGETYTWSATVKDVDAGTTLASRGPTALVNGENPSYTVAGLADGVYEIRYEIVSSDPSLSFTKTCYTAIDTVKPEIESVEVLPGAKRVGGTATVRVTVAEDGFPGGTRAITISYDSFGTDYHDNAVATKTAVTDVAVPLDDVSVVVWIGAKDESGNWAAVPQFYIRASHSRFDYNADGHDDYMAVRKADGHLVFYAGKGNGTFKAGVSLGGGWGAMDVVMAGDLDGDGNPDLLVRDTGNGTLYTYPGDGKGGLRFDYVNNIGEGWNAMSLFTSAGDYNRDGNLDLLAVRKSDAKLYFYPGSGSGGFGTRRAVGSGWNVMDTIATYGDLDGDGNDDLLARTRESAWFYVYHGNGTGGFTTADREYVYGSLTDSFDTLDWEENLRTYRHATAGGDYNGDGFNDILAVDDANGEMVLRSYDDNALKLVAFGSFGTGWNAFRPPAAEIDRTYEYTGDGRTDVYAMKKSDNWFYIYPGNGAGGFNSRKSSVALTGMNLIQTAGDFNGDGDADLLTRTSAGVLYMYPGDGYQGVYYEPVKVGTGWNSMSAIVSGQDFNGDGRVDVIAREKTTGYLWLYPGKGDGHVGARVKIGTGWNAFKEITTVGDLDHDGHADVLAIRASDNCMYFYEGRGNGTVKPGVETSCNWAGYDSVTAVGDFDGDGHTDWLARRQSDGALYLYKGDGSGWYSSRAKIGTGWNSMTIA